jgi:predicted phosphodiesterase
MIMVRFALISDIHFGKFSRTKEFSVIGEPIQDNNETTKPLRSGLINILKDKNVDYIFVAGDLTSVGSPQEFYYCEQSILSIAKDIGISQDHVILGLGNHDIDWDISKIYKKYQETITDSSLLELIKCRYQLIAANSCACCLEKFSNQFSYGFKGPAPFSGLFECSDFIIFVLNTGWFCTHDQEFKHGKLSEEQIEWFQQKSKEYRTDKRWKIVLMHHHPFCYSYPVPLVDISMVEEGAHLLQAAAENGIDLVLHGHRHHPIALSRQESGWHKPITFICAGSLASNSVNRNNGEIPNTLHIVELEQEPGVLTLYNFEYCAAEGWTPIKGNRPATPLDSKMKLGRIFNQCTIDESIRKLAGKKIICWDDLDDCLQFLEYDKLNQMVSTLLSRDYYIVGKFPDSVSLVEKGQYNE